MPGRRKSQLVSRSRTTRRRAAPFSQSLLAHNRQLLWISGFSPMDWLRKEERGADQGLGYEQSKVTKWVQSKRERSFHPRFEHLISAVGQIDCAESSVAVELNPAVFLYEGSFLHSPQFEIVDRKQQPFVSDFPTDSAGCLPSLLRDRTQDRWEDGWTSCLPATPLNFATLLSFFKVEWKSIFYFFFKKSYGLQNKGFFLSFSQDVITYEMAFTGLLATERLP